MVKKEAVVKLVYFGKKNPKKVEIEHKEKTLTETFIPFQAKDVDKKLADILLKNAGDIFKRVDKDERKPIIKHQPKTEGYVGEVPADKLTNGEVPADKLTKPIAEKVKEDEKEEEGKDLEDLEEKGEEIAKKRRSRKKE